jgi:hypothetical protein
MSTSDSDSQPELELPENYRLAIGTLTANSTILDHTVDNAIWVFLRVSPTIGRLITEPIVSTKRKIDLMRGIGNIISKAEPEINKRWADVGAKVSGANSLRSQIVHARWVRNDGDGSLSIARFEEGVEDPIVEPMPIKRLLDYSDAVAGAQRLLIAFLRHHRLEPSPDASGAHVWPPRYKGRPPSSKGKKT